MAKDFIKDPHRKQTKEIPETFASAPSQTFSLDNMKQETSNIINNPVGRPKKNKIYGTIRIQKNTVHRINALQNTLDYDTQDDLVLALLDKLETTISSEERTMYKMYLKTYQKREQKNNK